MELYDRIQNPIDDPTTIRKLINAYANSSKGLGGFYGKLTKTVKKEHTIGEYNKADADRFYSLLFNKWKNSILAMTKDEFIELYKNGSYGKDFVKMREFLKSVPDVTTMKEADEIFFGKKNDKELENALEKYSWKSLGAGSGWVHVCSRYLTAKKDKYPNVEHRLYLDTESLDTYKMTTYLIEKCDQNHLPYYFKFDVYGNRDDTIVIYSSTDNLTKYLEILEEIKREHPDLISRMKDPPALTGKIDGWIGYGSEPGKTPDGHNQSFNEVRAKLLESVIGDETKKWILNNRNRTITYQGQKIRFQDYVAMKSTEKLIEDLKKRYISSEEMEKARNQKKGLSYDSSVINDKLGYTLQDINSLQFKKNVFNILKKHMEVWLTKIYNGSYKDIESLQMTVRKDKKITFSGFDLEIVIQQLSLKIANNDPSFISTLQREIRNSAKKYGIDSEKFCFDIATVDKIRLMPSQNSTPNYAIQNPLKSMSSEDSQVKEISNNTIAETTKQQSKSNNINKSALNMQSLTDILNPSLMQRMLKLPNGVEIPAKQYVQEIVYPFLPKDGIVILNNGSFLSIKQFIEEYVMFECQEKYNGDFSKFMTERTRNNLGAISIEIDGETKEIDPCEITDFINPSLLEEKIKLPTGAEISARQFIQEAYAPHIPVNGRVTLKTGIDIPVKQYIEEVLLWESHNNGDIGEIISNTTRNNYGIVSADSQKLQETLEKMRSQINPSNLYHLNNSNKVY